jgi:hypothetical protein
MIFQCLQGGLILTDDHATDQFKAKSGMVVLSSQGRDLEERLSVPMCQSIGRDRERLLTANDPMAFPMRSLSLRIENLPASAPNRPRLRMDVAFMLLHRALFGCGCTLWHHADTGYKLCCLGGRCDRSECPFRQEYCRPLKVPSRDGGSSGRISWCALLV